MRSSTHRQLAPVVASEPPPDHSIAGLAKCSSRSPWTWARSSPHRQVVLVGANALPPDYSVAVAVSARATPTAPASSGRYWKTAAGSDRVGFLATPRARRVTLAWSPSADCYLQQPVPRV